MFSNSKSTTLLLIVAILSLTATLTGFPKSLLVHLEIKPTNQPQQNLTAQLSSIMNLKDQNNLSLELTFLFLIQAQKSSVGTDKIGTLTITG